ncbi:S9 family peptidase [Sphingomonas hylomeconis]|uniref:S9 family peptidase n=1 Tax=Sphingomonas hylomeconis TaxID=1395958 RepID=A0ABV7T3B7_9SPHN|nr:alpha/beta fold hydrolase [Sphingomonas hylomeconis]
MRHLLVATALIALTPGLAPAQTAAKVDVRTVGAATLENVPPIAPELTTAVARYQQSRSASVADWLPDGSLLIATRFGTTVQLHRVQAPGMARTQITFAAEPIAGGRAIPQSDRIAFSRDTGGDEWFQIYTMGPDGNPLQLTEAGTRNDGLTVSKDGRRIFWSQAIKGSGDRNILSADPTDPASRALVYKATGAMTPSDVSDDGKTLLMTLGVSNREQKLFTLDIASGALTEIAKGTPANLSGAKFIRGGRALLAVSNRGSDVQRLVEIDVATGRMTPIAPGLAWDVEDFELSDDGRVLAYVINEDGYSKVVVRDFVTRRALPQPAFIKGVVSALRLSPDGRKLAVSIASAAGPGDVYGWDVGGGTLARWTQSEIGPIDRARLPEPKLVRFASFDKLSVPAFVYRPKSAARGAKTPVLISIHGGPEGQARPGWSPTIASFVDTLGATVIVPNVRGSDGYGTKYLNLDNAEKREDSVRDIGALLDWIATQPDLDASRIAVIGGSYGGYMSLAAMTKYSDRLAGGVDLFGIGDWVTFLENTEAYRRDNRRAEYGDERTAKMKAVFAKISPRANVAGITKPMLIEQGVNDPRVPMRESKQMVDALRARGVPVSYLLFADEGHGWRKKPNQDLSLQVEMAFLRGVLGTTPAK